jgi:hypothetical protein
MQQKEKLMANDPFGAPSSATGITWADLKGSLLLIKVRSIETDITTVHGLSDAVRADVVVLDDKGTAPEGEAFNDTLIFPKVLQSQVKSQELVLGRLGQGDAKKGQSAPWMLSEATEADKVIGREYLAKANPVPF